ncbi:MAG: 50S ribosomal protein P1 [Candidatus Woesearchaeota archaeon]
MEYIYCAMLLHKAGKSIDESSVKKVLEAAGVQPDDSRIKALVAALAGVDIGETIKNAAIAVPMAVAHAGGAGHAAEGKKDDKKAAEEEKKSEEQAAAGLGSLFG